MPNRNPIQSGHIIYSNSKSKECVNLSVSLLETQNLRENNDSKYRVFHVGLIKNVVYKLYLKNILR